MREDNIRLYIYRYMRRALKHPSFVLKGEKLGMCFYLPTEDSIREYPELMKRRPSRMYDDTAYWFDPMDRDVRVALLDDAIEEMEAGMTRWQRFLSRMRRFDPILYVWRLNNDMTL